MTVSDTRGTARGPERGRARSGGSSSGGHRVVDRAWVADESLAIRRRVRAALARQRRGRRSGDRGHRGRRRATSTPEAVAPLVARWLPGFGELFRALSYEQVGSAAWLSRAAAGIAEGTSAGHPAGLAGARCGSRPDRLLVPELAHAARLLGRLD